MTTTNIDEAKDRLQRARAIRAELDKVEAEDAQRVAADDARIAALAREAELLDARAAAEAAAAEKQRHEGRLATLVAKRDALLAERDEAACIKELADLAIKLESKLRELWPLAATLDDLDRQIHDAEVAAGRPERGTPARLATRISVRQVHAAAHARLLATLRTESVGGRDFRTCALKTWAGAILAGHG